MYVKIAAVTTAALYLTGCCCCGAPSSSPPSSSSSARPSPAPEPVEQPPHELKADMAPEEWLGGRLEGRDDLPACEETWIDMYGAEGYVSWRCGMDGGIEATAWDGVVQLVVVDEPDRVEDASAALGECDETSDDGGMWSCGSFVVLDLEDGLLFAEELADAGAYAEALESTPYFGDRFTLGDFAYVVERPGTRRVIGSGYSKQQASKGATYIVVDYTIENLGKKTATALSSDFRLEDHKEREFQPSSDARTALVMEGGADLALSQLQPGIPREQKTAFEVPAGSLDGPLALVIPEKAWGGDEVRIRFKIRD